MADTILVINAGSSSIKFELFQVGAADALRSTLAGQISGIGNHPRLKAQDDQGRTVVDRTYGQAEIADVRIHGTTHQRPIDRFAQEARALMPVHGHRSFLDATVRERVVAGDWLVSIDANRYSVPFRLIGKTVEVVREGDRWMIRHRGKVVAEHPVLAGRAQLSVRPEHGPGALARNARSRYADTAGRPPMPESAGRDVQVRDLTVYDQLLHDVQEAA